MKVSVLIPAVLAAVLVFPVAPLPAQSDPNAESQFREFEQQLLGEKSLRLKFAISSEGPISSALQGQFRLKGGNRVEIDVSGRFQSVPVKTRIKSDGKKIRWSLGGKQYEFETPGELNRALVMGFTRLGLLDGLASFLGGRLPDHAAGGMEDWVQLSAFFFGPPQREAHRGRSLQFHIDVGGHSLGDAELWLSPLARVPSERRQTVNAKSGPIKIIETYEFPDIL